jgi:hypothetical protein
LAYTVAPSAWPRLRTCPDLPGGGTSALLVFWTLCRLDGQKSDKLLWRPTVVDFVVQPGSSSSPHERLALCSHGHRFCLTKSKTPISIILFGRSLDHTCKAASGSDDSADRPADPSMNSSPVQQPRTDNDQDQCRAQAPPMV